MAGYDQPRESGPRGVFSNPEDVEVSGAEQHKAMGQVVHPYTWNIDLGHEGFFTQRVEIDDTTVYHCADQLLKSHLYSALGAAWFAKMDLIVWMDAPPERIMEVPEARRHQTPRLRSDGTIKSRPFTYWTLGGDHFGLGMAMNRLRLKPGPIWERLGLVYEEGRFPFGKDRTDITVRYLKIDHKKTLIPPHRFELMNVVDSQYFLQGTPTRQMGMAETIIHVFDRESAMKNFPEIFEAGMTYDELAEGFAKRMALEEASELGN